MWKLQKDAMVEVEGRGALHFPRLGSGIEEGWTIDGNTVM
jgi:hypothetical protein